MPLVSVIMPVYNGEKYLAEAIESILEQTFTDFEFIIVDDGSFDGSAEIIRAYEKRDEHIRFIQLEANEGPGSARNHGIRAAQGEYIAAMDSDDISLPERLRLQVDYLESNPEIGAVGVGAQQVYADLSPRGAYHLQGIHALIALGMIVGRTAIVRASLMMRRRFLLESGGYNTHPDYRVSNDAELTYRLLREPCFRYGNILETQYLYRQHESNISLEYDPRDTGHWQRDAIERLLGEASGETMARFRKVDQGKKLSWRERRSARQDYRRIVNAMAAARWISPGDVACINFEVNRRLESTTPRVWQMFLYWWRHNIERKQSSETAP